MTIERMERRLAAVLAADVAGFSRLFLRPGLFLPPLMLSEDETEAVLLGLRYVDQRGEEVLTQAATTRSPKFRLCSLPQCSPF